MKLIKIITVGFSILVLTQAASAEVIKASGERQTIEWVVCLNDYITLDWEFDRVVTTIETKKTQMYTRNARQQGSAVDSHGNTWKFKGHWQSTTHVDLTADQETYNQYLLGHDVLIGQAGGPGNLIFRTIWRISHDDGIPTLDLRETTVSCMP